MMQDTSTTMQASITNGTPISLKNAKYNMAILELEAPTELPEIHPLLSRALYHYVFNIDRSGSMSITTPSDSSSKMEQTIITLINIINWMLEDTHNEHYITIILFDDRVETLTYDTLINTTNAPSLIQQIQQIQPRGTTNILDALITAKNIIDKLAEKPHTEIIHLFMTDGNPTGKTQSFASLASHASSTKSKSKDYYIGFGLDHNSTLLQTLAATHDNTYHFADSLETCGMVYSEILHEIIYNYQPEIILVAEGFEIYNYKTNQWSTSYTVPNMAYQSTKKYHIRQPIKAPEEAKLTYTFPEVVAPQQIDIVFNPKDDVTVENYIWRQQTLALLYNIVHSNLSEAEANTFLEQLNAYITKTNQTNNTFLQTLVDDVYVAISVKNTEYQDMYIYTRQTSQGGQRGYTVKNVTHLCTMAKHTFSQSSATDYGSLSLNKMTRSISQANSPTNHLVPSTEDQLKRSLSSPNNTNGSLQSPTQEVFSPKYAKTQPIPIPIQDQVVSMTTRPSLKMPTFTRFIKASRF